MNSGRVCAECVNRKSKWKYPAWWPRRAWPWAWPGSGGAEGVGDPLCPAGVLAGAAQAPPSHRLCLCARPSARMLDPARGLTVRASVSPCVDKEVQGPWGLNVPPHDLSSAASQVSESGKCSAICGALWKTGTRPWWSPVRTISFHYLFCVFCTWSSINQTTILDPHISVFSFERFLPSQVTELTSLSCLT